MINKKSCLLIILFCVILGFSFSGFSSSSSNKILKELGATNKKDDYSFDKHKINTVNNDTSMNFEEFNGVYTMKKINLNKNNKLTVKYNSKVSKGNFVFVLLDSDYKILDAFKSNKSDSKSFKAKKSGEYLLRCIGDKSTGNAQVSTIFEK